MTNKQKLVKYLNGVGKALQELSKEVDKLGIDKTSIELMKTIGCDLLYKSVAIDFQGEINSEVVIE